jgi:predicted transcriptional regulator
MAEETAEFSPLELATELTVAWLSNPNTRASAEDVPTFLERMHGAVSQLGTNGSAQEQAEPGQEYTPAVTARKSLSSPEHIISLIDGKPYKTLKRHLAGHGLTPAQYRERYGLKSDYPMVATSYAEKRRELAKKIGLGRKPDANAAKAKSAVPTETKSAKPSKAKAAAPAKAAARTKPAAQKKPARKKLGVQFETAAPAEGQG